ncbi:tat pathway signal sequence [Colletotrichum sojae]|uniref:Tat pathway signal sequence n=1 Tax=Colletotrichum sojae TaxID=2175907 RepID=A0A8H6JE99_9PEZI|nr:tat pathway signal sequence [Colletotrichum sojae]
MSFPMNHKLDHLKYESDEDDSPILRNVPVPTIEKPNVILSFLDHLKNESDPVVWEQYSAKVLPILDDLDPL